ncbi:translation initiation factor IF-2-like [Frankliniella occidentalis]|uniref:Translation initiation factor IF-2-like n=1 Tax=Frankliniella occidentalis TaxID=133901 RepID=A0A9C6X8B8_FRAOC|nr:translation initiation factor IF-2-like [Frankliniella occidentalis]
MDGSLLYPNGTGKSAMCRWTATMGLTVYLRDSDKAGLLVRMCMALPLLPAERIRDAFQEIRNYAQAARDETLYPTMEPFLDYVLQTWIDDIGPEHISVYRRRRRTNNDQESYHKTLVDTLGSPHGNPWVWMDKFREHEQRHRVRHLQASRGNGPGRPRRKQYVLLDRRVENATRRLERGAISSVEFLKICSYLCKTTYNRVALRKKRALRAGEAGELLPEVAHAIPEEEMGPPPPLPAGVVDALDVLEPVPDSSEEEEDDREEELYNPFNGDRAAAQGARGRGRGRAAARRRERAIAANEARGRGRGGQAAQARGQARARGRGRGRRARGRGARGRGGQAAPAPAAPARGRDQAPRARAGAAPARGRDQAPRARAAAARGGGGPAQREGAVLRARRVVGEFAEPPDQPPVQPAPLEQPIARARRAPRDWDDPVFVLEEDAFIEGLRSRTPSPARAVRILVPAAPAAAPAAAPVAPVAPAAPGEPGPGHFQCLDCREWRANWALSPCGHVAWCEECNARALARNSPCPMGCDITSRLRLYY